MKEQYKHITQNYRVKYQQKQNDFEKGHSESVNFK